MNSQQKELLGLLKDIHAICTQHGIRYFMFGGTLIGAVRNKGFLPWDDDADIIMPFDDWKKFLAVCKEELPVNRYLGAAEVDESYRHIVPRFVSRDTTAIHTCQSLQDDVTGTAIDVFILDPIADGEDAFDSYVQDLYLYSSIVNYANIAATRFEADAEEYWRYHQMELEKGHLHTAQQLEERLNAHHAEGSRYVERWQTAPVCYEREWFDHPVLLDFEDTQLYGPNGIDGYLTAFYGEDWPEVPSDIVPAKHNAASSSKVPCTDALDYYRPAYDRDRLYEELAERKRVVLQLAPESNAIRDEFMRSRAEIVRRNTAEAIEGNRDYFDGLIAEGNGAALAEILADYLSEQSGIDYIGRINNGGMYRTTRPIQIDVADDIAEAGLSALLATGRIRFISKYLRMWKLNGRSLTPEMKRYAHMLERLHEATHEFESGNHEASLSSARSLIQDFPGNSMFTKLICANLLELTRSGKSSQAVAEFENEVAAARLKWPEDGLFAKFAADCMELKGNTEQARDLYIQAAECTRNGFALHEIAEKTGYHPTWLRTPTWARKAGVPQWEGETPTPLDGDSKREPTRRVHVSFDKRQQYLLDLLEEVARFCERHGIAYILGPALSRSLHNGYALPAEIEDYCLILDPRQHAKLLTALLQDAPSNRCVDYMGNNARVADRRIRYHGLDSLHCKLEDREPNSFDTLYVSAAPLEPNRYPKGLRQSLKQWNRAQGATFPTSNRSARVYRKITGIPDNTLEAGAILYRRSMKFAALADASVAFTTSSPMEIDARFLRETREVNFLGRKFCTPNDLNAYASLSQNNPISPWLRIPAHFTSIAGVGYADIVQENLLDPTIYARRAVIRKKQSKANQAYRKFRDNFRDIKIAVRVKEISLDLLPRKNEIITLERKHDFPQLLKILGEYLKCAEKFPDAGEKLNFDDDIYRVMCSTQKHSRR